MTHSPDTPATPVVIADQSAVTDRMSARRYGVTPATPAPVIVWDLDALVSELKAVANGQIWRLKNRRGDYGLCDTAADAITALRALSPQPVAQEPVAHPDDDAVDRFAAAMKVKMATKRAESRDGWETDECSDTWLSSLLREHVEKGDPLDVGNLAMMLHQRGEKIVSLLTVLQEGA